MTKKQAALLLMITAAVIPACARAQQHFNERGTYRIHFMGVPFAKLWLALEERESDYTLTAAFKSTGIAGLFKQARSLSESAGMRRDSGGMQALRFEHRNDKAGTFTKLYYSAEGALIRREVDKEDDPWHRPFVKPEAVLGAISPGDMVFALRDTLRAMPKTIGTQRSLRFYEGKRLAEVTLRYDGEATLKQGKTPLHTYRIHLSRRPIDGFSDKELKRYAHGEPDVFLFFRQSDYFPVGMQAQLTLGRLDAAWVSD